ncbi:Dedicator of cytokinesis [Metarhizium album ARSEF 1941]|uniref:Dedicator of cytokinesis n=1 Tax=Metarhizium album (strain ARSEF 1941) TaxID=1081103 RepID=A0A0B2X024_METAS|nr:Dedicator of cytokinesis [Metarhizium album ARSEF 1941]KHO01867.1 Dedicator of cytokinesis [Metarhizium album ARSEF 1941]
MPWQPLPRIAFAVATFPFAAESPADLPLEIGDELYIIEETPDGNWLRGYLVAPPSLLAGLTSVKGQTLEARVFSGIFPRSCVEVREMLGEADDRDGQDQDQDRYEELPDENADAASPRPASDSAKSGITGGELRKSITPVNSAGSAKERKPLSELRNGALSSLSIPVKRDPAVPKPAAPVPLLKIGDETPTSAEEPLIDEIASCLREWHSKNLHQLLLSRQYQDLDTLSKLVTSLNLSRQQFLYGVLTSHEYGRLREKTVWDLVRVNKLCGGEVIVRDPVERGRILTGDDSVVEMTRLQSVMTLLDEPPQPTVEMTSVHHLLLDVKGFAGSSSEATTLVAYLVAKPQLERLSILSESFTVDVPAGGTIGAIAQDSSSRTLFIDLSAQDIGDSTSTESDLYLVVKVLASQQVLPNKPISRSGTATEVSFPRDGSKSSASSVSRSTRRSLMWGSKPGRPTFSRGSVLPKTDASEQQGQRPVTTSDGHGPPGTTSSSKNGVSIPAAAQTVQRTVGVGVLKVNSIMKQDEEVEQVVNIWSPAHGRASAEKDMDEDFDPLILEVMDSAAGRYERSRRGERLQVSLRAFDHPDADVLIKATPTLLSGICKTNRMGFSGAPTKPRSDIYLSISTASLARQHLLSRYGGSATAMPSGIQGNNYQVTIEVRAPSGQRFENAIYAGSNKDPVTTFKTVAAERGEAWNQTLRLSLSPADVFTAHVVMFLCDVPGPPFAIAYMPLWDRQAFIRDGRHGLLLYKIDENTSTPQAGPTGKGGYLSVPWAPRGRDEHSENVTGPLAVLNVNTFLCSTRFSQDRIILGLLKWKDLPEEEVSAVLRQLMFVPEIEVVKLLSDVLDGLFGILVQHSGNNEFEDLVFTALVRVLGIVHDRRFNLGPLVDQYAEAQFNYPFATSGLVRSFARLLDKPAEPETSRNLRSTFKVVRHILKFITHARKQQKVKEAGIGITSSTQGFTRQLRSIFKALDRMMRNPAPVLVGSQTLAVQHFHTWLPELTGLLDTEEVTHIAIDFMDSCAQVKGKLILYKLVLIINYSKLELFASPDQKSALCANTVRWISPYWGHVEQVSEQWREQVRLCCSVIASQADCLAPEIPDHIPRIIDSYLSLLSLPPKPRRRLSLLFPSAYPFPSRPVCANITFDESLAEVSAILSAVSSSPAGMQLELAADADLATVLENLLRVHMSILSGEAFPAGWLSLHIFHHKSTMRTLQYVAALMLESFLPDPDEAESFNMELWKLFFTTLLKLVGSTSLALETFPEQKRRAVWKIAGDVREHGAELLRTTWEAIGWETTIEERNRYGLAKIGGYQVQYVPTLVGPIVGLCLSVHEGLRRMAVEVLQTMIVSEWTLSEDLTVIQTEMIDSLDQFFKSKPLTESLLQKLFIAELLERFSPLSEIPDEPLYVAVRELVCTLDEFLDLLVAVHGCDDNGEATNIINRLRLMEFLRDMQKEEIFVRYVHQLAALQAESRNHAEAGLALRLHADLYEWDPTRQVKALADPRFPAQTQFERKEKIYFDMIKHFEEGESWSNALTAYKELQAQYESNVFDFAKLARTERAIATIYETISKSEKLIPRYFKVVYKGLGFPSGIRDKEFIYEGAPTERAAAFTDRMQEQYPSAQIVTSGHIEEVEGQFLIVSTVSPHRDLSHQVFQRARVPQVIRDFLVSSHPQSFSLTTKRSTSGVVENHYAEKTVFVTAEPFPTILRRSEIIETHEVRLDAHETALERIVRKTQEMTGLERRLLDGEEEVGQLLLDAISVSVNPSSGQSVMCYRGLLPEPEADEGGGEDEDEDGDAEPHAEPRNTAIKMALVDHAMMIKRVLGLFARSNNPVLVQKQGELQRFFEAAYEPEIALFAPPPPMPCETVSTPSTTFRGTFSPGDESPSQWANIATSLNGTKAEEAPVVRQLSLRQRSARLSFLPGRRQHHQPQPHQENDEASEAAIAPGSAESQMSPSRDRSFSKGSRRQSTFKPQSGNEGSQDDTSGGGRRGSSASKGSQDRKSGIDEHVTEAEFSAVKKSGSVRRRFSLFKKGIKGNKMGEVMGSVDEE